MKIKNTKDYLKYRAVVLTKEHTELSKEYDNNKLQITEINKKIEEIKSTVDEGLELFSPKAAEECNFNKQEVNSLQMKLLLLAESNKETKKSIQKIVDELRVINMIMDDLIAEEENNKIIVDRKIYQNDMEKIEFCAQIAESDPRRVKIELMKLIQKNRAD